MAPQGKAPAIDNAQVVSGKKQSQPVEAIWQDLGTTGDTALDKIRPGDGYPRHRIRRVQSTTLFDVPQRMAEEPQENQLSLFKSLVEAQRWGVKGRLRKGGSCEDQPREPKGSPKGGQFAPKGNSPSQDGPDEMGGNPYPWRDTFQVMPPLAQVNNEAEAIQWYADNLSGKAIKASDGTPIICAPGAGKHIASPKHGGKRVFTIERAQMMSWIESTIRRGFAFEFDPEDGKGYAHVDATYFVSGDMKNGTDYVVVARPTAIGLCLHSAYPTTKSYLQRLYAKSKREPYKRALAYHENCVPSGFRFAATRDCDPAGQSKGLVQVPHGLGRTLSNKISIPKNATKVNVMLNLLKSVIAPKVVTRGGTTYTVRGYTDKRTRKPDDPRKGRRSKQEGALSGPLADRPATRACRPPEA